MLFSSAEEIFFIRCLTGKDDALPPDIDSEKLLLYYPVTYLYSRLQATPLPSAMKNALKTRAMECLQNNQQRLGVIRNVAVAAEQAGIPLLFVKGAAEIALNAGNSAYMYSRTMADTDMICRPEDIERMHTLLMAQSHHFYDYGLTEVFRGDMTALRHYLVNKTGHLVYNEGNPSRKLELHCNVTNAADIASYPPKFIDMLWKDAQKTTIARSNVLIPSPEHMVVYSLCHAASPKNNILFPDYPPRQSGQTIQDYVHFVLGIQQLKLLCQLQLMFANLTFDRDKVQAMLSTVDNPLLYDAVALASFYCKNFAIMPGMTEERLLAMRHNNIRVHLIGQRLRSTLITWLKTSFRGKSRTMLNRLLLKVTGRFV